MRRTFMTCLLAMSCAMTALAQKPGVPNEDLQQEVRLAIEAARRAAAELGCVDARLSPAGHTDVPPVTRQADGRLADGAAMMHFTAPGCARQNVLLIARPGQPLRAMGMLPGGTAADPLLQRDAVRPALALAAGRLNGCQAARIVDTRVAQPGRAEGGRVVSAWVEEWVAAGCGGTMRIEVTLTPSPRGGTDYSLRAAG